MQTPNLDRMATEGVRFTDYYAGCTVCRPSRLSLWSGLHMGHTPISSNAAYQSKRNETTVPELLKQAGYATGGVGKWAMGLPACRMRTGRNESGGRHSVGVVDAMEPPRLEALSIFWKRRD